jgi:AraC-like DNA-binding protein
MDYSQNIYFDNLGVTYNTGGFLSIFNKDWTYYKHRFDQCKFYFITEGECFITIEGKEYHGKKGDWFFIPANAEHSYRNVKSAPFKKYWAHFDITPNSDMFSLINLPFVIKVENFNKSKNLFSKLLESASTDDFYNKLNVKSILISLLAEYVKLSKPMGVNVKSVKDERLNTTLRYINENIELSFSVEQLAKIYFAHPSHFIRAFREKTGVSPLKYVRQKKMERAKFLLEKTDLTMEEIAEKLSLTDGGHFCRLFKNFYSVSPSKYRALYGKAK